LLYWFLVLWNIGFAQKWHFFSLNNEPVFGQVDGGLISLEHVQTEQEMCRFPFHDGEAAWEKKITNSNLCRVNTSQDLGGTDTTGYTGKSCVNEPHDATGFGISG
jgi:hypothetical protein